MPQVRGTDEALDGYFAELQAANEPPADEDDGDGELALYATDTEGIFADEDGDFFELDDEGYAVPVHDPEDDDDLVAEVEQLLLGGATEEQILAALSDFESQEAKEGRFAESARQASEAAAAEQATSNAAALAESQQALDDFMEAGGFTMEEVEPYLRLGLQALSNGEVTDLDQVFAMAAEAITSVRGLEGEARASQRYKAHKDMDSAFDQAFADHAAEKAGTAPYKYVPGTAATATGSVPGLDAVLGEFLEGQSAKRLTREAVKARVTAT